MRGFVFFIFCFLLVFAGVVFAQYDSDMNIFPQSVATVNDISSAFVNPAGLAPEYMMGFRYMHSFPDSTFKGDDGFIFGLNSFMISAQWLKHGTNINRLKYLAAGGARIFPNFYWGISYARFSSHSKIYSGKWILKNGFIYRPAPALSLGMVIDDINRPKFGEIQLERKYAVGVGIRPFGQRLTLSVDAFTREKESLSDAKSQLRIEVTPKLGFDLAASYQSDGSVSLGLAYGVGESQIGASSNFHESDFTGGSIYYNQGPIVSTETGRVGKHVGIIRLDETIAEEIRGRSLFGVRQRSFFSILNSLKSAAKDKSVVGLYLDIERFPLGFAATQEMREAINEFKASGKKVVAYLNTGGNAEYYVASAADEIYLSPTGYLELKGLSAELVYIKGSLDKLGLQADFVGIGQYKTAPDMFTHSTMSEAESIQTNELLDDLFNQMISDISRARGFTEDNFRSILDSGPFSPKLALKKGLVNGLLFDEDITEHQEKYFSKKYPLRELIDPTKEPRYSNYWGDPAKVAIVYATGEISGKFSRDSMFGGRTMGENTLSEALRQARTDREIKAVVLRVNSPGGEVIATDGIYRELEKIKSKKPLIISIGNVGASGGYYIACVGDEIFMMPGTITGSIGIFTGKLVARGLYDKLGANKVVLKRGLHADIRSDWRPINDEEKLLVYTELKEFYDDFVAKVARWRRLETAQVDSLGQGRVWSGQRALDLKLGTNQGGLMDAINLAINKSNLPQGQPVKYEIYPKYGFSLFSGFRPTGGLASILADKLTDAGILGSLNESGYYYRLPYNIEIK